MPERQVISNTSPLLYLHQVRQLELLEQLYGTLTIPDAVGKELARGGELGFNVPSVEGIVWIHILQIPDAALLPAVVDLGPGEAEVIALGLAHPGSLLILDDQLGRRIAGLNQLTFTGTLGVILKAKRRGLLEAVTPVIQALQDTSMRLGEDLVRLVLEEAGENPARA